MNHHRDLETHPVEPEARHERPWSPSCTSRLYAIAQGTVRYAGGWAEFAMTPDLLESHL